MDPIALLNHVPAAANAKDTRAPASSDTPEVALPIKDDGSTGYDPDMPEQSVPDLEVVLPEEAAEAIVIPDQKSPETPAILRPISVFELILPAPKPDTALGDVAIPLQETPTNTVAPETSLVPDEEVAVSTRKQDGFAVTKNAEANLGTAAKTEPLPLDAAVKEPTSLVSNRDVAVQEASPAEKVELSLATNEHSAIPPTSKQQDIAWVATTLPGPLKPVVPDPSRPSVATKSESKSAGVTATSLATAQTTAIEAPVGKLIEQSDVQLNTSTPLRVETAPATPPTTAAPTLMATQPTLIMPGTQTLLTDATAGAIDPSVPVEITDIEASDTLRSERIIDRSISPTTSVRTTIQATLITQQIAAAVSKTPEGTISIRLDPPELGRVTLKVSLNEAGATALVSADRPDVVDLLRRNEAQLAREMKDAGLGEMTFAFAEQDPGGQRDRDASQGFSVQTSGSSAEQDPAIAMTQGQMIQLDHLDIRL